MVSVLTRAKKCAKISFVFEKDAGVAQLVEQLIRKKQVCDSKSEYANVAQSVEQLIRNQQVVCSSHIISSRKQRKSNDFRCFHNF